MDACLDCDSPYHRRCPLRDHSGDQAMKHTEVSCDHPRCDGDTHYTGRRDPITNEDEEEGACPNR